MTNADSPDDAADSLVVECDIAEPLGKVWRALTVPDLLAASLRPNDIRPEIGRRFAFQAPGAKAGGTPRELLAVEPNRLIRYRWRSAESERVQDSLKKAGVEFRLWYGAGLQRQTYFANSRSGDLSVTENIAPCLLGLPIAPDLSEAMVSRVVSGLLAGLAGDR